MSDLKKNIFYNILLTVSNYLIPILVFPYISRILGVKNIGLYSFVDSVTNYFILFSMMGIMTVGIREVAKNRFNPKGLVKVFSNLFFLNALLTIIVLLIFIISVLFVPQFRVNKEIFFIGAAKIIFNLFLIEWLFIGLGNFKLITLRSLATKLIYIISVFIFIKKQDDVVLFYLLTVLSILFNAVFNFSYSFKYVRLFFKDIKLNQFFGSSIKLGIYKILTNMYTTFNVIYLGFIADDKEVGNFTIATKLQLILLSIFTAYVTVTIPHITAEIKENNIGEVKSLISKSFQSLYCFTIPVILISISMAPEILNLLWGYNFNEMVISMRIVMILILVIGLEQIIILQILTPFQFDRAILINSIIGAIVGIALNILLVPYFKSIGSSLAWAFSEIAVLCSAYIFMRKMIEINLNFNNFLKQILFGIPYVFICYSAKLLFDSNLLMMLAVIIFSIPYFIFINIKILKNDLLLKVINIINIK